MLRRDIKVEFSPREVGEKFADAVDDDQIEFLLGFGARVYVMSNFGWSMQCRHIVEKIKDGKFSETQIEIITKNTISALQDLIDHLEELKELNVRSETDGN